METCPLQKFKVAGEVFASSIVQGGPAPGFLCPLVSLFRPFKGGSKHPMDYDFCTDLT